MAVEDRERPRRGFSLEGEAMSDESRSARVLTTSRGPMKNGGTGQMVGSWSEYQLLRRSGRQGM